MADQEMPTEQPNSVEITRSPKGDLSFKVKAYGETVHSAGVDARIEAEEMTKWADK